MTNQAPPAIQITDGRLHFYYIFDVCDSISLARVRDHDPNNDYRATIIETLPQSGPLPALQFARPPLMCMVPGVKLDWLDGVTVDRRIKLYDYGTVAIRYTLPFAGTFEQARVLALSLKGHSPLYQVALRDLADVTERLGATFVRPHDTIFEDYITIEVSAFDTPVTADRLLAEYRDEIASLISLEQQPLSRMEREETTKSAFTYAECELAIFTWDVAFVFDDTEGGAVVDGLVEFANTQLAELRTYDSLLDRYLDEIYKAKSEGMRKNWWQGGKTAERQAETLRLLLVDVQELSDKAHNALKFVGDAYYARLYRGLAQRLALGDWQKQLESKLQSVQEIYRFYHDQAEHGRAEFLEVLVIILISVEILMSVLHFLH